MSQDVLVYAGTAVVVALICAARWLGRRGVIATSEARFDSRTGKQIGDE